ncbi:hypothetical protein I2486_17770 [Cellulophaga sp. E16_2]|uniref:hypothetical protein n=1 Tax=Cellulophaga sp. E16_2 TaxID=2789297 RepID=UPI001A923719|nr:hypothetical protein [Cellulophaga sp. E16_2]MBO0593254.1 hypothetical protein [Cellulophaga sp. E16_2]
MQAFETKKEEAQDLQTQITQTKVKMDKMVFNLYSLKNYETGIIENALSCLS